jgi:hypothetical protein
MSTLLSRRHSSPNTLESTRSPGTSPRSEPDAAKRIGIVRITIAGIVALAADTVGAPFGETLAVVFDLGVALVLCAAFGFRIPILIAFVLEAIPGVGLLPSWLAVVGYYALRRGTSS